MARRAATRPQPLIVLLFLAIAGCRNGGPSCEQRLADMVPWFDDLRTGRAAVPPRSSITGELEALVAPQARLSGMRQIAEQIAPLCPTVQQRLDAATATSTGDSSRADVVIDATIAGLRDCDCSGLAEYRSMLYALIVDHPSQDAARIDPHDEQDDRGAKDRP